MTVSEYVFSLGQFEHVRVTELPNDGLRVQIDRKAEQSWGLPTAMVIGGALIAALGWNLPMHIPAEWRFSPMATQARALPFIALACAGIGLLLAIVRLANGRSGDIILEVRPGSLRADRYIAGDHVIRAYNDSEVQYLSVEAGMLYVYTKIGGAPLASFGPPKAMPILAALLAARLWHLQEIASGRGKTRLLLPAGVLTVVTVEHEWFVPACRLEPPAV